MLDANNNKRLVFGLVISAVLIGVTITTLDFQKTAAITIPSRVDAIQYSFSTPIRVVVIHPNEEKIVPFKLMAPASLSSQLNTGVTVLGNEGQFTHTGKSNLPNGISATLDKSSFNLQSMGNSTQIPVVRDTTNMAISASQDAQVGKYTLAAVVWSGNQGSATYVIVEVQK